MNLDSFDPDNRRRRAAALGTVVFLGGAVASWLLARWSMAEVTAAAAAGTVPVSQGFPVLIAALAALACAAISGLSALGVATLASTTPRQGDRRVGTPRVAGPCGARAAAVLLALALGVPAAHATSSSHPPSVSLSTAGTVTAAWAKPADIDPDPPSPGVRSLPGWSPTTPTLPSAKTPSGSSPTTSCVRSTPTSGIVITRGDTLWDIAAAALGPKATRAEIEAHWPDWYQTNRHVIGPNPNLLLPGQILQPPSAPGAQP